MWFEKFLRMMRFHQIVKDTAKLSAQKPNRQVCEDLFVQLEAKHFKAYHPHTGMSVKFTPLYPTIDSYTSKLRELHRLVKQDKAIPPDWNDGANIEVSVDRFMISSDGFYLDITQAVSDFKDAGYQLCISMKDSDTESHGVQEHNLRMLTKLFINLRPTVLTLINVSLTKNA